MLRSKTSSRAVVSTSKQSQIMSDLSPSSFHGFFTNKKNVLISDSEDYKNTPSPTSILDTKSSPTTSFVNPFGYDPTANKKSSTIKSDQQQSEAIGLALVDSFIDEDETSAGQEMMMMMNSSSPSKAVINRMVLLGSKLKVQIPINPQSSSPVESPRSPADFGIKTRKNIVTQVSISTPKEFHRQLSLKEMELSEDYTCVITHGPNPKTTHIFDDCIVETESCNGDLTKVSEGFKNITLMVSEVDGVSSPDFMSFCKSCKKVLGQDKEIDVYRGETVFCSQECRCRATISE